MTSGFEVTGSDIRRPVAPEHAAFALPIDIDHDEWLRPMFDQGSNRIRHLRGAKKTSRAPQRPPPRDSRRRERRRARNESVGAQTEGARESLNAKAGRLARILGHQRMTWTAS
jgi:hypothetical protein